MSNRVNYIHQSIENNMLKYQVSMPIPQTDLKNLSSQVLEWIKNDKSLD